MLWVVHFVGIENLFVFVFFLLGLISAGLFAALREAL